MKYTEFRILYDDWRKALRRNEPNMWGKVDGAPCPHFVTTKADYKLYVRACQQDHDEIKAGLSML